jgi:hypothetical protein
MTKTEFLDMVDRIIGDKRLFFYGFEISEEREKLIVNGFIDTHDSIGLISKNAEDLILQVKVLEDMIPPALAFGMVIIPVTDMRKDPRFRTERIHQLIFGEFVKVLILENEYALVKDLRTGFIGYVQRSHVIFFSIDAMNEIKSKGSQIVVSERFSNIEIDDRKTFVPFGTKLFAIESGKFWHAFLPNGDTAKIPLNDVSEKPVFDDIKKKWSLFLGTPYLWGGASSYGYDCSGYVGRLYDYADIQIPRDADLQQNFCRKIEEKELKFGDLIFFPGHVGMYIENGNMVHANLTQGGVGVSQILNPKNRYEENLRKSISKLGRIRN